MILLIQGSYAELQPKKIYLNGARTCKQDGMTVSEPKSVFISYAKADTQHANRLYDDLKKVGLTAWKDTDIKPGANRENAISSAMKRSGYFIPLFSSISIAQSGNSQKELRDAVEINKTLPQNKVYIIPVRLDDCQVPELHCRRMKNRILKTLTS